MSKEKDRMEKRVDTTKKVLGKVEITEEEETFLSLR